MLLEQLQIHAIWRQLEPIHIKVYHFSYRDYSYNAFVMYNVLNSSDNKWAGALLELQVYICMTMAISCSVQVSFYDLNDTLLRASLYDYSNILLSAS